MGGWGGGGSLWIPDRPSHSTALWTGGKKKVFVHQSSLSAQTKPSDHPFPLEKKKVFGSVPLTRFQRTAVCVQKHPFESSHHQNRRPGALELLPDAPLWGEKPFVVLFSSLFSMAHLRNAARVPFCFWNCCLVIHILGVNVLLSVHITHLGG